MRMLALAGLAALAVAPAASAEILAPQSTAAVEVSIGPELLKKAKTNYGLREVERLAEELRTDVRREVARTGVMSGGKVELVLVDVAPNRPTFKQMADKPGLSFESFSLGGARIEGRLVSMDGVVTPVSYRWYETDIHQAPFKSTWSDAEWTIDRFAARLGRGETLARR